MSKLLGKKGVAADKWDEILKSEAKFQKYREGHETKIKSLVRKGIPKECRGKAWQYMCGSSAMKSPGKYEQLLDTPIPEERTALINIDLPRTFPKMAHFQNPMERDRMRRVLHAYAAHDSAVGYVQVSSKCSAGHRRHNPNLFESKWSKVTPKVTRQAMITG